LLKDIARCRRGGNRCFVDDVLSATFKLFYRPV
jgi:hypothetical protein